MLCCNPFASYVLQIKIIGSYGAKAQADLPTIIKLAAANKVDVASSVTESYSLHDAGLAFNKLHEGHISGRCIIDMDL